jgi:hypothetical protein
LHRFFRTDSWKPVTALIVGREITLGWDMKKAGCGLGVSWAHARMLQLAELIRIARLGASQGN